MVRVGSVAAGEVMTLPLEAYVARVLAGEADPRAAEAAQEALAIAVRTYAMVNAGRHRTLGYDLCDTTHCQVLRAATPASRQATLATAGQILTLNGKPVELFYSASCGGQSAAPAEIWPAANMPYLRSAADEVHDADVPWVLTLTRGAIEAALLKNNFAGQLLELSVDSRTASGRVGRLRVTGMKPESITGEQLRAAIGYNTLRSTLFSLATLDEAYQFSGRGFGHGVGMCVIGAGRRAARGESARQILAQYFPGLELTPVGRLVAR